MFSRSKKEPDRWSRNWHPSRPGRAGSLAGAQASRLSPPALDDITIVDADEETLARLDHGIAGVSAYLNENWIATTHLINPMLELWDAANAVHPAVARPVEEFLTMLVHRTTVTPADITVVVDQVRVLALQASVIAGGTRVS